MAPRAVIQDTPKYRQIFKRLARDIASGKYVEGQKFPSEATLVRQFGASRITVGRAVRELKDRGLVQRVAGSGTYVHAHPARDTGALFGLLIPDLGETEIFEPICRGMAAAPESARYGLLWGHADPAAATKEDQAMGLCRQFIEQRVSGVFFAPLELPREINESCGETNRAIVAALGHAQIPIVLLDRAILPFPEPNHYDLVGINNRRAGSLATEHLLRRGCRKLLFVADLSVASTVEDRIAGFRETMLTHGLPVETHSVQRLPPIANGVNEMLQALRPDGFVCVNDRTAGRLMHSLLALGYKVPADFKMVGIDDAGYAQLLPVPLTTVRQPCREIGQAAMAAMLDRIQHPDMLPRDILLDCRLVVRASCGATLGP